MKGGAFTRQFSNPANAAPSAGVYTPKFDGLIPEISVRGIPRSQGPFERTYHPRDAKLSDGIAGFVKEWEGEKRDDAGFHVPHIPRGDKFYTIGYGHNLGEAAPPPGTRWTERQALDQLKRDMFLLPTAYGGWLKFR